MDTARSLTYWIHWVTLDIKPWRVVWCKSHGVLHLEHIPQDSPLNAGQITMEFWNILIQLNQLNALTTNIPADQSHIAQAKIKD